MDGEVKRCTRLIVRVKVLQEAVVSLERKSPPRVHRTEQHETILEMEGEVVIRNKVVPEQVPKRPEIVKHVPVETVRTCLIHGTSSSEIHCADERNEVVEE